MARLNYQLPLLKKQMKLDTHCENVFFFIIQLHVLKL